MKQYYNILFLFVLALACNNKQTESTETTYIGGEIVNPKTNFVIIDQPSKKLIDTVALNENNRFSFNIKFEGSDLILFRHGDEYQTIIIEPKDSLMLRLNTLDFDESLVFAGAGSKKNNYLIKVFLENEEESKKLMIHSQKKPEEFFNFVENRRTSQLKHFYEFAQKNDFSDYFKNIIASNINYNNFADLEIYPFAYYGENNIKNTLNLPDYFYKYRDTINYNDNDLSHFYAYNRFLSTHIDNLSIGKFYQNSNNQANFERNNFKYNLAKIELINQLIDNSEIKNRILRFKTRDFISMNQSIDDIENFLNHYKKISHSKNDIEYIENLKVALISLKPGNELPNFEVIDINKNEFQFSEIIKKPTLIYFWSLDHKQHFIKSHDKVNELKKQFPDLEFISVNINDNHTDKWKETTSKYHFKLDKEFKLKTPHQTLKTLAINYLNKVFVINEYKEILTTNINIYDKDVDKQIHNLFIKN